MKPRALVPAILALFAIFSSTFALAQGGPGHGRPAEHPAFQSAKGKPVFAPGRLLVRFRKGASQANIAAAHAAVGAQVARTYRVVSGLQLVRLAAGMPVPQALLLYRQNPDVLYAEPDYIQYADATPNDPEYVNLWGLHNTGQPVNGHLAGIAGDDIDAPLAWNLSTGSADVVIGTIDTGVDYNHPDLAANIYSNTADCNSNGIDDDGNGYVDDCHGINAIISSGNPMDDNDHGSHVAGTIGAVGNNNLGVVGVNWNVRIYACKFLNSSGSGSTSDAIECMNYFAMMKDRGVNLVATNNSWGGSSYSQALYDAIAAHLSRGILFLAAAGNDGTDNDAQPHYPSNYFLPNIISVAATDNSDHVADFSDFGRYTVHIGAPGVDILSTIPFGGYEYLDGTSMATPHVTGVAALLKAQNPLRSWIDIKNLILAGGDYNHDLDGLSVTGSRLNAYKAMTCSSSTVRSRLQPVGSLVTTRAGGAVSLAELDILCGAANGGNSLSIPVTPGGTLTLPDDGVGTDKAAHDGVYTASFTPALPGSFTLTFPGNDLVSLWALDPYASPTSTTFTYRDISASGVNLNLDDDTTAGITPAFPVRFGGATFTSMTVGSNGVLSLAGAVNDYTGALLPTAGRNAIIAPWWDDLAPRPSDPAHNVYWAVTGSAPNRELVVEWRNVPHFESTINAADNVTFEVVLFESSSNILFLYKDAYFGGNSSNHDRGWTASVGVQIASNSAVQYSYRTTSLNDSQALLWQLSNPVPTLTSLAPSSAFLGGSAFTLTVTGTRFVNGSVVRWNGASRTTYYGSSTQLTADIPASDLNAVGNVNVTVFNPAPGGGTSAPLTFTVGYPPPTLTSVEPPTFAGTLAPVTITVYGSGFFPVSFVRMPGNPAYVTHYVNATTLTADLDGIRAVAGTWPIVVTNPAPGGGTSNQGSFTVTSNVVPVLTSLTPSHLTAGGPAFTLHVTAQYFAPGAVVKWNGSVRDRTLINIGNLDANILASDIAAPGTASVTVTNPAPGGGQSAALTFTMDNAIPGATSLGPSSISIGHPQFVLNVHGTSFNATSVVRWNGVDRTTTFVSGTQLQAAIPATDVAALGTASVTVYTPGLGGGTSSPLTFTVRPRRTANDFNADNMADILWQNISTGDVAVWLMNGPVRTSAALVATGVDLNWKAVGVGDFSGDGMADILWQNSSSGGVVVWLMNGAVKTSAAFVATGVDPSWKVVGVGDFDGDGKADILWQNVTTGDVVVWLMNGASKTGAGVVATGVDLNWKAVGVGDFNGDGMADILWQNLNTGGVVVWLMDGATKSSAAFVATGVDSNWKVVGAGDFDADDKADILWQNSSSGGVVAWLMDGAAQKSAAFVATGVDPNWKAVAVSDFGNDHKADILWQNSSSGGVVVWMMNGVVKTSSAFVATGVDPNWRVVSSHP